VSTAVPLQAQRRWLRCWPSPMGEMVLTLMVRRGYHRSGTSSILCNRRQSCYEDSRPQVAGSTCKSSLANTGPLIRSILSCTGAFVRRIRICLGEMAARTCEVVCQRIFKMRTWQGISLRQRRGVYLRNRYCDFETEWRPSECRIQRLQEE
jgi:hypothetical protein